MKLRLLTHLEDQVMLMLSQMGNASISGILGQVTAENVSYRMMYNLMHRLHASGLVRRASEQRHNIHLLKTACCIPEILYELDEKRIFRRYVR